MKRKLTVLILVAMILSGCVHEPGSMSKPSLDHKSGYDVLISGCSDSVTGITLSPDYTFWVDDTADLATADKIATVEINGKTFRGELSDCFNTMPNNYTEYHYKVDKNITFHTDAEGNLVDYRRSVADDEKNQEHIFTEDEYLQLAKEFLGNYVNTDLYQVEFEFDEVRGVYFYQFRKHIGEYETADAAWIKMLPSGEVVSFTSSMLGRVPADTRIDFSLDDVVAAVQNKVNTIYADVKERYDKVEYEIEPQYVTITDSGEVAMIVEAEIDMITYLDDDINQIISELITFVVLQNDVE